MVGAGQRLMAAGLATASTSIAGQPTWCLLAELCLGIPTVLAFLQPRCTPRPTAQTMRILTSWYLSKWSSAEVAANIGGYTVNRIHYIGGYLGFALGGWAGRGRHAGSEVVLGGSQVGCCGNRFIVRPLPPRLGEHVCQLRCHLCLRLLPPPLLFCHPAHLPFPALPASRLHHADCAALRVQSVLCAARLPHHPPQLPGQPRPRPRHLL